MRSTMPEAEVLTYKQAKLGEKFKKLVLRRSELAKVVKSAEAELKEISDEICAEMVKRDLKRVQVEDLRATYCEGRNVRIDQKLLLNQGVDPTVIAKATVMKSYTYVQVRPTGEGEEE